MTNHLNDDGTVRLPDDPPPTPEQAAQAAQRGMAHIRALMGWDNQPPQTPPESAPETHTAPATAIPTPPPHPHNLTTGHQPPKNPPAPHPPKN